MLRYLRNARLVLHKTSSPATSHEKHNTALRMNAILICRISIVHAVQNRSVERLAVTIHICEVTVASEQLRLK